MQDLFWKLFNIFEYCILITQVNDCALQVPNPAKEEGDLAIKILIFMIA